MNWMLEKEGAGSGGLLCDEMGLGKTIQMVGLIKNQVKTRRQATLLIAPVAVLGQWKSVLKRSNIRVWVPRRGKAPFIPSWSSPPNTPAAKNPHPYFWQMESNSKDLLAHSVYVIGYEAAQKSPSILKDVAWDRVIYDEAHRLGSNNQSTELALSFTEKLKVKNIWLLTGTPIVNEVSDLRHLFRVAGIEVPPRKNRPKWVDESKHEAEYLKLLEPIIKNYVMARTMDQLRDQIADAPPKPTFKTFSLDFSTEEEGDFYRGMFGIISRRWKALEADGVGATGLERLKLFMRLRQLSLHPQIYIAARKNALKKLYTRADWNGSSTKFDKLQEIICDCPTSHKWIIFTHFHEEMNMLENMFRVENKIELVQQYHGGLSAAQKADVIERSHMPIAPGKQEVLLVQLQSGGTGINLQHFDRIIFTGPWWTKALMEQAVGRAVRIGQKNEVQVISLSLKEEEAQEHVFSIDKLMLDKAAEKGELCRGVLASANTAINKVKEENAISV